MGKRIIFNDDFSENSIVDNRPIFYRKVKAIVGSSWFAGSKQGTYYFYTLDNAARVRSNVVKFADLGSNVTGVKITPKSGYKIAHKVYNNIYDNMAVDKAFCEAWTATYNNDERTLSSSDGNSFVIMVAPIDSGVTNLVSNNWDTYMTVELIES